MMSLAMASVKPRLLPMMCQKSYSLIGIPSCFPSAIIILCRAVSGGALYMGNQSDRQRKIAARVLMGYAAGMIAAILLVIAVGYVFHIHPANWHPHLFHYRRSPQ
jgi:hypothetical protein